MANDSADNGNDDGAERGTAADSDLHDVSLSLDAILSLLAHHRRRDLLRHLVASPDSTASIDECVGYLMKREEERSGERPGHDQVEATLHHVHIPKLADAGVLEYDARSQELRYWGHDRLESWLDRIQAEEAD